MAGNLGRSLSSPGGAGLDSMRYVIDGPDGSAADISELRAGFKQGFIFEVLDLERGRTISEGVHVMVLNPVRYNLSEPFQVTLTPGEDDTVVSEENGIIIREITLEGTFGISEKRARGFQGAQGGGNPLSGADHFQALRNLFRRYSALKKDPQTSAKTQMIFHALRDDDHFVVVPREFTTPRDAGKTRTHHEYRISLAVVAPATASGLIASADDTGLLGEVTDVLRDISEGFNDMRAGIADVTKSLSEIQRKVGNINAILNNAIQFVNAVGGFLGGVTSLINYPLQLAAGVMEGLDGAADTLLQAVEGAAFGIYDENARSLRRISAAGDRIALFGEKFEATLDRIEELYEGERALSASDIAAEAAGATPGSRTRVVAGGAVHAGLSIPRSTGLVGYVVSRTDTIESIAAATGTTPEAVIVLNDLRPPYITGAGGPGIRQPGDVLLVPASTGSAAPAATGVTDYLTAEEALYGVDIAIERRTAGTFDIMVNVTNDPEDFGHARGVPNVVQGTEITINTERGTTVFIPSLGIRRNIGVRGTLQHVLLASITLREAMLQDRRISGIESSRVVLDSNTGELSQEITPIVSGQRSSAVFVLPFGSSTGGGG